MLLLISYQHATRHVRAPYRAIRYYVMRCYAILSEALLPYYVERSYCQAMPYARYAKRRQRARYVIRPACDARYSARRARVIMLRARGDAGQR